MRRLLLTIFLTLYAVAFTAPLISSADGDASSIPAEALCQYKNFGYTPSNNPNTDAKNNAIAYQELSNAYANAYSETTCGEENSTTHLFEKGDCSKKIITEITEPLAPSISLGEDTKIIDVYAGLCCYIYTNDDAGNFKTCTDARTIYTNSLEKCKENGVNCSPRQWLIAESGIGLLKLFVKQVYTFAASTIGIVLVGLLIFHGIKISASGVSGDISDSKTKIWQALSGLVLLFTSGLILYTINPDFFS